MDPQTSMREEARYHLRKLDQDVAAFYRQQLLAGEGLTLHTKN
jgi:hypothetical protein